MVEVTDERDIAAAKRYLTRVAQACGDTKEVEEVRADHPAVEFAREVRIEAAKAERDRIVAWLRSDKPDRDNGGPCRHVEHSQGICICNELADALESQP